MREEYKLVFLTLLVRLGVATLMVVVVVASFWGTLSHEWVIALASLVVTGCGLMLSLLHVGRPGRLMNMFSNRRSMMTLEALISPPLMLVIAAFALFSYLAADSSWLWILRIAVLVLGAALIFVTGKVYHLRARPSWTTSLVLYEYFASAVCLGLLGYGTMLVVLGSMTATAGAAISYVFLPLLVVEAMVTYAFRTRAMRVTVTAAKALSQPRTRRLYAQFVVVGLLAPAALGLAAALGVEATALAPVALVAFFLGAVWWRVLFFRSATLIKLTPDIAV